MASPSFADVVIDGGPDYFESNVTKVAVCSSDPNGSYAAISGVTLAEYTVSSSNFTIADGDVSGRKISLNANLTGNNATADGSANFIVFHNGTDTWYGTVDGDGDSVNNGSPCNINSGKVYEVADPT